MFKSQTVRSEDYSRFFTFVCFMLQKRGISCEDWIYVVDNASINTWAESMNVVKKLHSSIWLLPSYTPSLAPVEIIFKYIKSKVRINTKLKSVNYSVREGQRFIVDAMKFITSKQIFQSWIEVIIKCKSWIFSLKINLNS